MDQGNRIPLSHEMQAIFIAARGNGKSQLALEKYRKMIGISDEAWEEMKREAERRLGYDQT